MTNRELISYHQELLGWRESILSKFHAAKIAQFYKQNGIRINTTMEKLTTLNKKFFQYENEHLKIGEDQKPILLPDMKREDFDRELEEIMSQEVNIII